MSVPAERRLARLRARMTQQASEIEALGFVMKGTLLQRLKRCSSPGCACHAEPPRLHGPYWQWTHKVQGKTRTRVLSDEQAGRYRQWMDNAQRLNAIVEELYAISGEADQILREQEKEAAAERRPPRAGGSS